MVRLVLALLLCLVAAGRAVADPTPPSKKERLLAEKAARPAVRRTEPPAVAPPRPLVSLRNLWTHEVLPVEPTTPPSPAEVDRFLRCHFTNQRRSMDGRLIQLLLAAAARFQGRVVEVVSAYRSPKYNLMLRKKGHEVGRESQHPLGQAVDFRIPGLPAKQLLQHLRALRSGGVGSYPRSQFVHADVGRLRFWRGR